MNAQEYVAKAIGDKQYLQSVIKQLPDAVVAKIQNSEEGTSFATSAELMSYLLNTAASSMGVDATEQEIEEECKNQCPASGFASVRILVRAGRMITKEAHKRKL